MVDTLPSHFLHDINIHDSAVRAVRFNYDGQYCLTCGNDKSLKLFNPYNGVLLKSYNGHGYEVLGCDASADSSKLISCSADRTIIHWDVATGKILKKYRGHLSRVNCCKFNQTECTLIISGSYDSTVRIWDTRSRSNDPIQILDDAKDSIPSLQVSQHEILTGSVDGYTRLYDLRKGRLTEDCIGEPITSVTFTNDSQCVLVSSLDSKVRLMDKDSGGALNTYQGHTNKEFKIDSCLTSTDSHIISGSEDGSVYIWDLITASVTTKLENVHKSVIFSLCLHPKKSFLVTASTDSVKLWSDGIEELE